MFNINKKQTNHYSNCKICYKEILKGTEQVSANLGSGYYYFNYHLKCFIKRYERTIMKLAIEVLRQ